MDSFVFFFSIDSCIDQCQVRAIVIAFSLTFKARSDSHKMFSLNQFSLFIKNKATVKQSYLSMHHSACKVAIVRFDTFLI